MWMCMLRILGSGRGAGHLRWTVDHATGFNNGCIGEQRAGF
jgi:hypothetical protein